MYPYASMISKSSLADHYDDFLNKKVEKETETISTIPEKMLSLLKKRLDKYGLNNIQLIEKSYVPLTWQETAQIFKDYPRNRAAFLKTIAYSNIDECMRLGLKDKDLKLMKLGISPENYNTHLKIPFDFGGTLDFENFSLIKSHPTHDQIHNLIELQISNDYLRINKKVFIPSFKERIYND